MSWLDQCLDVEKGCIITQKKGKKFSLLYEIFYW
jgi:hypothetical protein